MKVGIFTFPNSVSYGAVLQMYALCRAVNRLGHEAEAINYYSSYMKAEKHCNSGHMLVLKHTLERTMRRALHAPLYAGFAAFEKKNVPLYPKKFFSDKSRLPEIGAGYDAVICGSDQVWNPDITGSDLSYFLDFCGEGTRRISYAPSFALETLPADFAAGAREELLKFSSLSVRELQGQAVIAEMIGREVPVVVDPTMLIETHDWRQLEAPYKRIKGEYLLYFTVKGSSDLFKKSREFAKQNGLKMVVVGGKILKKFKNNDPVVHYAVDISPAEWLWLVDHARYVATNSFHGTVFSVLYEKDFYLELSSATNSRLSNLVNMLGLDSRIVPKEAEMVPSQADYTVAREILPRLKGESLDYLKNALSEESDHG